MVHIGKIVVTVDPRLYLRAKTVRRVNRHRQPGQRMPFHSKNSLACNLLEALRPLLPAGRGQAGYEHAAYRLCMLSR